MENTDCTNCLLHYSLNKLAEKMASLLPVPPGSTNTIEDEGSEPELDSDSTKTRLINSDKCSTSLFSEDEVDCVPPIDYDCDDFLGGSCQRQRPSLPGELEILRKKLIIFMHDLVTRTFISDDVLQDLKENEILTDVDIHELHEDSDGIFETNRRFYQLLLHKIEKEENVQAYYTFMTTMDKQMPSGVHCLLK